MHTEYARYLRTGNFMMKPRQIFLNTLLTTLMMSVSLWGHPADPNSDLAKYSVYGKNVVWIFDDVITANGDSLGGWLGSDSRIKVYPNNIRTNGPIYSNGPMVFSPVAQPGSDRFKKRVEASSFTGDAGVTYLEGKGNATSKTPVFPNYNVIAGSENCTVVGNIWQCTGSSGGSQKLPAGRYGTLTIPGNQSAKFGSGIYEMDELNMAQGFANLTIAKQAGEFTRILVKTRVKLHQSVFTDFPIPGTNYGVGSQNKILLADTTKAGGQLGSVLLYYQGTATSYLVNNSAFSFTFVAPNSRIIAQTQTVLLGQLLAKSVDLHHEYNGTLGGFVGFEPSGVTLVGADVFELTESPGSRLDTIPIQLGAPTTTGGSVEYSIEYFTGLEYWAGSHSSKRSATIGTDSADFDLVYGAKGARLKSDTLNFSVGNDIPDLPFEVYIVDDDTAETDAGGLEYFALILDNPKNLNFEPDENAAYVSADLDTIVYLIPINSEDINNQPPDSIYLSGTTISEGSLGGIKLTARDPVGDSTKVTFSLQGGVDFTKFAIIGGDTLGLANPAIYENSDGSLEDDTLEVIVRVTDEHGATYDRAVEIVILNSNDEKPQAIADLISLDEGASDSIDVLLNDKDTIDNLVFSGESISLLGVNGGSQHASSVTISGSKIIYQHDDSESVLDTVWYELNDGGIANGSFLDTSFVVITIAPINDNAPSLILDTMTVSEADTNGHTIGEIQYQDVDGDRAVISILTQEYDGAFVIVNDSVFQVADSSLIDHEVDNLHWVEVQLSDGLNVSTDTLWIKVLNVNDNAPKIANAEFTMAEGEPNGYDVGNVNATDADGGILIYSIVNQEYSGAFSLDSTGLIEVADSTLIDYEVDSTHVVLVKVHDGVDSVESSVLIRITNINDNPPDVRDTTFVLSEDAVNGDLVGVLNVVDADLDTLEYSIVSQDPTGAFEIDSTGAIYVFDESKIDYEQDPQHSVVVRIEDGVHSVEITVTINLIDVNDVAPIISDTNFTISETASAGTVLGEMNVVDPESDPLSFKVISQSHLNTFGVNNQGEVVLVTPDSIDYELYPNHTVFIEVFDTKFRDTAEVTISVINENDNLPVISNASFSIYENISNGDSVGIHAAVDADGDSLVYVIRTQDVTGMYGIDSNGTITVLDNSEIDFELDTRHDLVMLAISAGDTVSVFVTINILDINDNLPTLSGDTIEVSEEVSIDQVLTTIVGEDGDKNDLFTYGIQSGNTNSDFKLVNGDELSVAKDLVYTRDSIYDLKIMAVTNSDTTYGLFVIKVIDVNVKPVIFSDSLYVDENSLSGDTVSGKILAIDEDLNTVVYTLIDTTYFVIDSLNGTLLVREDSTINYEEFNEINIIIAASDDSTTSYLSVDVTINDLNDAPTVNHQVITLDEDAPSGVPLDTVFAEDEDANARLVYMIKDPSDKFEIDSLTGELYLKDGATLDYEEAKSHTIHVIVNDGVYQDSADVVIQVENIVERAKIKVVEIFDDENRSVKNSEKFFTSRDSVTIVLDRDGVIDTLVVGVDDGLNIINSVNNDPTKDINDSVKVKVKVSKVLPVLEVIANDSVPVDTQRVYYVNSLITDSIWVNIQYINQQLDTVSFDSLVALGDFVREGKKKPLSLSYTDVYGNTQVVTASVILDTEAPEVSIISPANRSKTDVLEVEVDWTAIDNGDTLDFLDIQILSNGTIAITRSFTDFAGNTGTATHYLKVEATDSGAKIGIIDPLVEEKSTKDIRAYFERRDRLSDPAFDNVVMDEDLDGIPDSEVANIVVVLPNATVSSQGAEKSVEIAVQTDRGIINRELFEEFETLKDETRFGLTLELFFPINGGLSSSKEERSGYIPDDYFTDLAEEYGWDSVTRDSIIAACDGDSTIWNLKVESIQFHVFDHLGQYVTKLNFDGFNLADPRYQDDDGRVTLKLEIPQLKHGFESQTGAFLGSGVYILSGTVKTSATPRACLEHVNTLRKRVSSTNLLEKVGYKRNN